MSAPGHMLLSRILTAGSLAPDLYHRCLQAGITADEMPALVDKYVFQMLGSYLGTHRCVPGQALLANKFPQFIIEDDPGVTFDALLHETREEFLRGMLRQGMVEASKLGDAAAIASRLSDLAAQAVRLGNTRNTDYRLTDLIPQMVEDYNLIKEGNLQGCYPWPWEEFQREAGPLAKDDYVVICGRPKSMKTMVLTYLIAFYIQMGLRVLVYTKEMTPARIAFRTVAFMNNFPYREFRNGTLPYELEVQLYAMLQRQSWPEEPVFLSGRDVPGGHDTVEWFWGKCKQHRPHIAFVDGLYLMSDDESARRGGADWLRVTNISRKLRALSNDEGIPVLATTQASDEEEQDEKKPDKAKYGRAIKQDATLFMQPMIRRAKKQLALVMGGTREFDCEGFVLNAVPCLPFTFAGLLSAQDITAAVAEDEAAYAKAAQVGHARGAARVQEELAGRRGRTPK